MIPKRKISGTCEISTATFALDEMPPAFQGEAAALNVQVSFMSGGQAYVIPSGVQPQLYLYYPARGVMTPAQDMTANGSSAAATLTAEDQALPGAPYLVIQLADTSSGALIVSCMTPISIIQTRADQMADGTAPNPSEVIYVGRAPYIGSNQHWMVWNNDTAQYVDSGIDAVGPKGDPGDVSSVNGKSPDAGGNVTLGIDDIDGLSEAIASAGSVKKVADVSPDSTGNVPLTAAGVGALPQDGTAADSDKLGGKAPAYYVQPYNLLDNSDFTNPVNQRGADSYGASWAYAIDRWIVAPANPGSTIGLAITAGGVTVTSSSGDVYLIQRVPIGQIADGAPYTLAYKKADGAVAVQILSSFESVGGTSRQIVFTVPAGTTVVWAALYKGEYTADTLPPYVPKGYGAEIAECMRYYRYYPMIMTGMTAWSFYAPYIRFDIPMRKSPTSIKFYSYTNKTEGSFTNANASEDVAGAQANNTSKYGFRVQGSGGNLVEKNIYMFYVEILNDL